MLLLSLKSRQRKAAPNRRGGCELDFERRFAGLWDRFVVSFVRWYVLRDDVDGWKLRNTETWLFMRNCSSLVMGFGDLNRNIFNDFRAIFPRNLKMDFICIF